MAIEKVKEYFNQFGIAERVQEFTVSSATVELAAQALHCEPCRIAKTLSFMVDGHAVLIVTAGDVKIDNSKYKAQFGTKAKMLTPDEAKTLIGHECTCQQILDTKLKKIVSNVIRLYKPYDTFDIAPRIASQLMPTE